MRDAGRCGHPLTAHDDIIVAEELPGVERDQFKCTMHSCLCEGLLIALLRIRISLCGALGSLVAQRGVHDLLIEGLYLLLQRALIGANQFVELH